MATMKIDIREITITEGSMKIEIPTGPDDPPRRIVLSMNRTEMKAMIAMLTENIPPK